MDIIQIIRIINASTHKEYMKTLLALLFLTSCVTARDLQSPNRRERDRRFFIQCVKDLYNQGLSEANAIEACKEAMTQPN